MLSFTRIIIFAAGLISLTSAAAVPLQVRTTCGSVPNGSGVQAPLSQPGGITTAQGCQASCESNNSCKSFLFGMADNNIQCMLFSVPAAQVPSQNSPNLEAFDKACTGVPDVVPTASNPQGTTTGSSPGTGGNGATNPSNSNPGSGSNAPGANAGGNKLAARKQCGTAPTGQPNNNVAPISTPANINSNAACQKSCQATSSCQSFEFGDVTASGVAQCRLFAVPASTLPVLGNGQSIVVYDVGCLI